MLCRVAKLGKVSLYRALRAIWFCVAVCFGPTLAAADSTLRESSDSSGKDPALAVDYYDGLRLFDAGQPDIAVMLWIGAAQMGDAQAMATIAEAYEVGTILPADRTLANFYHQLAVRFGKDDAPAPASAKSLSAGEAEAIRSAVASFEPHRTSQSTEVLLPHSQLVAAIQSGELTAAVAALAAAGEGKVVLNQLHKDGLSPTGHAIVSGNIQMMDFVLQNGGNLYATFGDDWSLLHFAALGGHREIAEGLIKAGLNAAMLSPKGLSAAEVARKSGHDDLAVMLAAAEKDAIRLVQEQLNTLGYDVGAPDGVAGPRTRAQIAIFAAGAGIGEGALTPLLTRTLAVMAANPDRHITWGGVVAYDSNAGGFWQAYTRLAASDRDAAKTEALASCQEIAGAKGCKVEFLVPQGACFALAGNGKSVFEWSPAFASQKAADAEAIALCKQRGGGKDCSIQISSCVQ